MADGVRCVGRTAQGGEDGEHQRVHTENPHNFQRVAPCRAAGEQAQRAEHNADNGKLIGAALAQLGMGVIDQPARKNIRKSVDDFTYHQHSAHNCGCNAKGVAAVNCQVSQNDYVQAGHSDVRAFPRHQAAEAEMVGVVFLVSHSIVSLFLFTKFSMQLWHCLTGPALTPPFLPDSMRRSAHVQRRV